MLATGVNFTPLRVLPHRISEFAISNIQLSPFKLNVLAGTGTCFLLHVIYISITFHTTNLLSSNVSRR